MEDQRFDGVARALAGLSSTRRSLLSGIAGGVAAMLGRGGETAAARCVAPGKKCRTKTGKQPCCGGAKCQGPKCKCPPGRPKCGPKCCAKGQRCQNRRCVATKPNPGCTGDVCANGCPFKKLVDAVEAATPGSTIHLCAGTYPTPELAIGKDVTIRGAGTSATVVAGDNAIRVISVAQAATVFLHDLTITGGVGGTGTGISNQGTLTLTRVAVTGNSSPRTAQADGAGIANLGGTLNLIESHVTQNESGGGQGGGIHIQSGEVTLTSSTVTANKAVNGGGIHNQGGTVRLIGSSVADNTAGGGGGVSNTGTLILSSSSQIVHNLADGFSGGGISNGSSGIVSIGSNCSVTDNDASFGGGIANNGGSVTLDGGTVTLNEAIEGGGIHTSGGVIRVQNGGSITDNVATTPNGGGGIFTQSLLASITIDPDSVVGNTPRNCRPPDSVTNCLD